MNKEKKGKNKQIVFGRRVRGVVGTCNRKPHTLLEIANILSVVLDFFSTKIGIML
jgi:hypothetical protein